MECLGLISLLRRRCTWMLVTDATADFTMDLVCLRETMRIAESERICSFFDPDNPCRGVEPLLQDFCRSKEKPFLRLCVLYDCWESEPEGSTADDSAGTRHPAAGSSNGDKVGEIYFIRMRLLDREARVKAPRISKDEVLLGKEPCPEPGVSERMCSMPIGQIGGCCCECCHVNCNGGCGLLGTVPNLRNANQFMTPTQFALLCRLGYELSKEAVDSITTGQKYGHQMALRTPALPR